MKCKYCNGKIRKVKNFGIWYYPENDFHMSCHIKAIKNKIAKEMQDG